jgi:hypothetical protein
MRIGADARANAIASGSVEKLVRCENITGFGWYSTSDGLT